MMRKAITAVFMVCTLAALPSGAPAQTTQTSSGACSPNFAQSPSGSITITCGADRADLKKIQASLNQLVAANHMSREQTAKLLESMNQILSIKQMVTKIDTRGQQQSAQLDRIIEILERQQADGQAPSTVVRNVEQLARDTLARTVQKAGDMTITLRRVEVSYGSVSFYFDAVNDGRQDARFMLFGGGSFGNGGSAVTIDGQRILASDIEFGGQRRPNFVTVTMVPGIKMSGRVDFRVAAGVDDIALFELGYASWSMRPEGYARFPIN